MLLYKRIPVKCWRSRRRECLSIHFLKPNQQSVRFGVELEFDRKITNSLNQNMCSAQDEFVKCWPEIPHTNEYHSKNGMCPVLEICFLGNHAVPLSVYRFSIVRMSRATRSPDISTNCIVAFSANISLRSCAHVRAHVRSVEHVLRRTCKQFTQPKNISTFYAILNYNYNYNYIIFIYKLKFILIANRGKHLQYVV